MLSTPAPMKHVTLRMLDLDSQKVSLALADIEAVHLIQQNIQREYFSEISAQNYQSVYEQLHNRFNKIIKYVEHGWLPGYQSSGIVPVEKLFISDAKLKKLWKKISDFEEEIRKLHEKSRFLKQLRNSLNRFESLDIDLGQLNRSSRFLKIIIGTIPHGHIGQLQRAFSLANFVVEIFNTDENVDYIIVSGDISKQMDVIGLLKPAGFNQLFIPEEFHDYPDKIRAEIESDLKNNQEKVEVIKQALKSTVHDELNTLQESFTFLLQAGPFAKMASHMNTSGYLVILEGWVPVSRTKELQAVLDKALKYPFQLTLRDPEINELSSVPSLQHEDKIFRPFQKLIRQYGTPQYSEIDPTYLFTLSYVLMFGMMFGDIGHGAVIILMGFFWRNKLEGLFTIASLTGVSSILFGFIYGSLFGYEDIVEPLWMSPMHDPEMLLLVALLWGMFFLLTVNLLSMRNLFSRGDRQQALFGSRGLTGVLFYLASVNVGYELMSQNGVSALSILMFILFFTVILFYQWFHVSGSLFERIIVVVIEGLEQIISNVSGSLSFLRVAAFSLNHIALAAAIFAMAGMMENTGESITIILGNIFIIGLEGAIVTIQCLRLEYYEGFSRFFSGNGKRFKPLKLEIP